jgi:hypothetical protein
MAGARFNLFTSSAEMVMALLESGFKNREAAKKSSSKPRIAFVSGEVRSLQDHGSLTGECGFFQSTDS